MTTPETNFWRKCSSCKKEIGFKTKYYECSVSTCTGLRTGYVFCSVPCWEVHLPGARHRDAGAVEKTSPATADLTSGKDNLAPGKDMSAKGAAEPGASAAAPRRILVGAGAASSAAPAVSKNSSPMAQEVLVVVSKMKQYVRDISDMNTSDEVSRILSDKIRLECEKAITNARAEGRKTILARDFK
jgi:hypothetical protein